MARFKRCTLHIGFEKTGSTSIQAFLTAHVDDLAARGYFVPRSLARNDGFCNHTRLAAYALDHRKLDDDLRLHHGIADAEQTARFREQTEMLLAAEAEQATGCRLMLLSNEHLSSRIDEAGELARLQHLLSGLCEEIKVLAYLRGQADLVQSIYNEAVKSGFYDMDLVPDFSLPNHRQWVKRRYFEYAKTLDLWADVFGPDNIAVRLFEPGSLLFGDVVQDFLFRVQIDPSKFSQFPRVNEGLDSSAQIFLEHLNRALAGAPAGDAARVRERVVDILMDKARGRGRRLTGAQASDFQSQFAEDNERVRARWFPGRASLFDHAGLPAASEDSSDDVTASAAPFRIIAMLLRELISSRQD